MKKRPKVFCPHCRQKVDKGNFCGNCGQKLVRVCDCWILERPFNCGFQKCPNIWETEVAILKIFNNNHDKLYRIFHKSAFEALIPIQKINELYATNATAQKEYMELKKEMVLHADKNVSVHIDDMTKGFNLKGKIEIVLRPTTL